MGGAQGPRPARRRLHDLHRAMAISGSQSGVAPRSGSALPQEIRRRRLRRDSADEGVDRRSSAQAGDTRLSAVRLINALKTLRCHIIFYFTGMTRGLRISSMRLSNSPTLLSSF